MDIVTRLAQLAENDMKAEGVALDAKHTIEELRKDVTAFWNEMELMRSDLSIYAEEIERLREALKEVDKAITAWMPEHSPMRNALQSFIHAALQQRDTE